MASDRVIRWLVNHPLVAALRIRAFLLQPHGRIKVYLDDARVASRGWYRARKPAEVIALVKTGHVGEVSLDFDLGLDKSGNPIEGYEFATWLEREVVEGRQLPIPELRVHSANLPGHTRLLRAVESIKRIAAGDDPRFPLPEEPPRSSPATTSSP
jgi:hypothetical protein